MTSGVERLLHQLDLQQCDSQQDEPGEAIISWRGDPGQNALNMRKRLFGGLVVAQTIVAAGRTSPDRDVHSVQQVFLRAGQADMPLIYRVEPLFSGRTYGSLRVEVHQDDQLISHAQVGLSSGIDGPDRQAEAPVLAARDTMVNRDELRNRPRWQDQPIEMRIDAATEGDKQPTMSTWMRPVGPMPADPLMHRAVLGFASDRGLMSVAWRPHATSTNEFVGATLDHTIWFHRQPCFDDWHSYDIHSPSMADGRGINHGTMHRHDGTHIASTAQQGTFRPS